MSLALSVAPAQAHAVLVSSNPPAGATLGATPGTVTLVYDEPLEPKLSTASVTSPSGRKSTATVSGKTMKVRLLSNAPGVYRVDWKTVSEIDGHTITGHFEFGVGVAASAGTSVPQINGFDIGLAVPRGIEYALMLLAFGVAVLQRLAPRIPVRLPVRSLALALLVAGLVVVVAEGVVAGDVLTYLGNGLPGWSRAARLVLEAGLLVLAVLTRRLSLTVLTAIAVVVAVAGHGADVEPSWQGIVVNAAHLVAAGVWAGGIMALAVVRLTGQWDRAGRRLLPHFTRVAPWAFGLSVVLGALQAYQLLGSPAPLTGTDYGITLLVKAGAIALMVPLSLLAWRRLRISVREEALLALVAVAAAAALAAYPVIPKEAREALEDAAASPSLSTKPKPWAPLPGDLTMGGRAGSVMTAMTLHPGRPGRNTIKVYLATPATKKSRATVEVGGRSTTLTSCGPQCRTGHVTVHGPTDLAIKVSGKGGGTAHYAVPALPAPDATALAKRANRVMDHLHSYRVKENLSGVRSAYAFRVPHQMFLRTFYGNGPQDTLWIGRDVYTRGRPSAPWKLKSHGVKVPVPYYVWEPFLPFVDATVVGHTRMRGTDVTVLSVFGGHGADPEAVWFTLYVDTGTGRVLRSRMWATNHFMDDRYLGVNQSVTIPSPDQP